MSQSVNSQYINKIIKDEITSEKLQKYISYKSTSNQPVDLEKLRDDLRVILMRIMIT